MTHPRPNYENEIGALLFNLPMPKKGNKHIYNEYSIENNVSPTNREVFIQCIKNYVDKDFGCRDGFEVLFSNDFKSVLKIQRDGGEQ